MAVFATYAIYSSWLVAFTNVTALERNQIEILHGKRMDSRRKRKTSSKSNPISIQYWLLDFLFRTFNALFFLAVAISHLLLAKVSTDTRYHLTMRILEKMVKKKKFNKFDSQRQLRNLCASIGIHAAIIEPSPLWNSIHSRPQFLFCFLLRVQLNKKSHKHDGFFLFFFDSNQKWKQKRFYYSFCLITRSFITVFYPLYFLATFSWIQVFWFYFSLS